MIKMLNQLRKDCLQFSYSGNDGNLQSAFSSIELLYTLYWRVMNWSLENSRNPSRDRFVLSKGQSTLALHAVFVEKGLFEREEVMSFCAFNSRFSMQADRTKFPEGGYEISAGSLGHGFPVAVGMAHALKIKSRNEQVYVLAGDGEMNEGTMWEACMFAKSHQLDNICLIIDNNDSIGAMIDIESIEEKVKSFGFVCKSCDGHNVDSIEEAIRFAKDASVNEKRPSCILAHTKRGYGSQTLMEDRSWFHRAPSKEELMCLIKEVDEFEKHDDSVCF